MNAQTDVQEKGFETAVQLGTLTQTGIPIKIVYRDGKPEISTGHLHNLFRDRKTGKPTWLLTKRLIALLIRFQLPEPFKQEY